MGRNGRSERLGRFYKARRFVLEDTRAIWRGDGGGKVQASGHKSANWRAEGGDREAATTFQVAQHAALGVDSRCGGRVVQNIKERAGDGITNARLEGKRSLAWRWWQDARGNGPAGRFSQPQAIQSGGGEHQGIESLRRVKQLTPAGIYVAAHGHGPQVGPIGAQEGGAA